MSDSDLFQNLSQFALNLAYWSLFIVLPCFTLTVTYIILSPQWKRYRTGCSDPLEFSAARRFAMTRSGLLGAGFFPALAMFLFYSFVMHIWMALGRWPFFGEALPPGWLMIHAVISQHLFVGLVFSLYGVAVFFLLSLFFKKWRWISGCCLTHALFIGLSCASIFLAPDPFLNWLFD